MNDAPGDNRGRYDTPEQIANNMAAWREAMQVSHAMLMAGLRDRVGPGGDLQAAYQQWNQRRRELKLQAYERAAERYHQRMQCRDQNGDPTGAT